jgi:uncharacterized protein (TIGR00369 family)
MRELLEAMMRGEREPPPVGRFLGLRLTEVGAGEVTFELDADPELHANPMGTVHGGIICDLADAALGAAYASELQAGETFTTLELKANFLRPVRSGRLTAHARVVKFGRTVGLVECDVLDDAGALVARVSATCMTLRGEAARDRSADAFPGELQAK